MSKRHLLRRIVRLPAGKFFLLLEAAWWLCVARVALAVLPFPRIARYVGAMQPPSDFPPIFTEQQSAVAKQVAHAIRAASLNSPVELVCLPQALAAWQMLHLRHVPSRLHFGKPLVPEANADGRQTHAWLSSAGVPVTGYPVAHGCIELGFFARQDNGPRTPAA